MRTAPATSSIVPPLTGQRSFPRRRVRAVFDIPRRRVRAVFDSLITLVLVKHDESETQLQVSDDGDPIGAVWIHRTPVLVDPKNRGRFLVVTLTRTLAQQKGLSLRLLDRARFLPEERADLEDAIATAARSRRRMTGQSDNRPTWSGGRNVYA
jgi:hypothetical protein